MGDYVPPGPEIAEKIRAHSEEMRVLCVELEALSDDELRAMIGHDERSVRRRAAFSILLQRIARSAGADQEHRRSQLVALCGDLLNHSDAELAFLAIRHCPLVEERHIEMVRTALGREDSHLKAEAAIKLARIGDATIFPTLLAWFNGSDEGLRNVAMGAMARLGTDEARKVLSEGYETTARGEADRAVLADALLGMGDPRADFLQNLAKRGEAPWSVFAATSLFRHGIFREGLQLMLHILDHGSNEAKRDLVWQICHNLLHSPNALEADGLREAREWVQKKLETVNQLPLR